MLPKRQRRGSDLATVPHAALSATHRWLSSRGAIVFEVSVGMMESSPRRAARKGRRRRLISAPERRAEAVAERRAEGAPWFFMGLEPESLSGRPPLRIARMGTGSVRRTRRSDCARTSS